MATVLQNEGEGLTGKGRRVTTWLPDTTIHRLDGSRGYYSRSQFIEIAIDKFLAELEEEKRDNENKK